VALHDKQAPDAPFVRSLRLIKRAASDERNFVKKGVSWALRSIGTRNRSLHQKSIALASELAESADPTVRWIGKDVLRDLTRPIVEKKVAKRSQR
jgi:3-methyladenine DNA glycosylase AlkD